MITHLRRVLFLAVAGMALAGCATLPQNAGRDEVEALLAARGVEASPDGDRAAVDRLLAEVSARPLQAHDAVRLALLNNPGLEAAYAGLGFAVAEVYEAGRPDNPRLSASLLVPDAGGAANQVGLGIAQDFTQLLLLPARERLAKAEFVRVQQQLGAQTLDVAAATEAAWYRLNGAWQVVSMRESVAESARSGAELAARFFAAGNIDRLELSLQQAAAAEADLELLAARAEVNDARAALNGLMGLAPGQDRWKICVRLSLPPARESATDELLALADANRLELLAARGRVASMAEAVGVSRRFRLLGDIEAGVETERETDRSRLAGPVLGIELPLFDRGHGRVARAEAALRQAEAELRALEIAVGNEVQHARAAAANARRRVALHRDTLVPLREAVVARMQERVNFMLSGPFGLLEAKRQEYEAWQGYLEAVRDYWLARVALARAVGTALPLPAGGAAPDPALPVAGAGADAVDAAHEHNHAAPGEHR